MLFERFITKRKPSNAPESGGISEKAASRLRCEVAEEEMTHDDHLRLQIQRMRDEQENASVASRQTDFQRTLRCRDIKKKHQDIASKIKDAAGAQIEYSFEAAMKDLKNKKKRVEVFNCLSSMSRKTRARIFGYIDSFTRNNVSLEIEKLDLTDLQEHIEKKIVEESDDNGVPTTNESQELKEYRQLEKIWRESLDEVAQEHIDHYIEQIESDIVKLYDDLFVAAHDIISNNSQLFEARRLSLSRR